MIVRAVPSVTAAFLVLSVSSSLSASDWYVDISVTHSGDGTSWESAFKKIQAGIDAASDGDTAVVAEGTYAENIWFNGKNIVLTSTNPLDAGVVAATAIRRFGLAPVVSFSGSEDETCVLEGFTIRHGFADNGGGICGGTSGQRTHATIRNNVIRDNAATKEWPHGHGGGIAFCDGLIEHNRVIRNSARRGGGLYECGGTIRNNVIVGNSAEIDGGGLLSCHGAIENNTILRNNGQLAGGLSYCDGAIRNCIVWGNAGTSQLSSCSDPTYSCIGLWTGGGVGNISLHPYFVDAAQSDFHLKSWSPCIDAGDPASPFSKEPEPNGDRINMGSYGNTPEAASASPDIDKDGLPDDWELEFLGNLGQGGTGDPDGDCVSNFEEYRRGLDPASRLVTWHVDASAATSDDGTSWETAFHTIQEGLDAADDGDTVLVSPGTYVENIEFSGEDVILRSSDPDAPSVVESTVIDGGMSGSVVGFVGTESESCVLTGFTIRNGSALCGGGIRGDGTQATVRNNRVLANSAEWFGGGVYGCDGRIDGNTISDNYAFEGGGLCDCHGLIRKNVIQGNSADELGGGLYGCSGTIERNEITDNSARDGGGLSYCDGAILRNSIKSNLAEQSGGGLAFCGGVVQNNIVAGNSADQGGGLYYCDGTIENDTIVYNLAPEGSGLSDCTGTILNCIIWGNQGGDQVAESSLPTYCSIENWAGGGEGNVAYYAYFVDPAYGDYHLLSWSACIDAGDPTSPFFNEPEPNGGRIDLGAYGNTSEATSRSPDSDADGLPDDWEIEFFGDLAQRPDGDPDGDLIPNIDEYRRGLSPRAWYVDAQVISSGDGKSWETAFKTIQEGVDAASDGETVIVAEGACVENIQFEGKNIVLRSTNPLDPDVVAATVIDGDQAGSVVTFAGTEDETCALSGFTIRNGRASEGAGIDGSGAHGTISNNVITASVAERSGGGVAYCDGAIQNNVIASNSAERGGGLYQCNGTIENNTIAYNVAPEGSGLCDCTGTILNCIMWGNRGGDQTARCSVPSYSCIQSWSGGGTGNVALYPYFVRTARRSYRLESCSPCIDAGDPAFSYSNEPQPNGGRIDMGAYGNTPEATSASPDTDADLLPDDWEMAFFGELAQGAEDNPDGDFLSILREYRRGSDPNLPLVLWYVDASVTASGDGTSWETAFKTIQEGIDAASDDGTVIVAEGTYRENVRFRRAIPKGQTIFYEGFDTYTNLYTNVDVADAGWTVVNVSGEPQVAWRLWSTTGQPLGEQAPNIEGMTGNYMISDSDLSSTAITDEELITPEIDCTDWVRVRLHFNKNYRIFDDMDHLQVAEVDVRAYDEDIGTWGDWVNLLRLDMTILPPWTDPAIDSRPEALDLSAYDGKKIQIRWHFYEAVYDYWFAIDEITVSGDPAGTLPLRHTNDPSSDTNKITLRSKDPSNPVTVANTTIDGGGSGAVVTFEIRQKDACVLSGFTIRNGTVGISGAGTDPTIQNNVITGNSGSGLTSCNGTIQNNTICDNTGGGLAHCNGTIQNNTIRGNSGGWGGGLCWCKGKIINCIIWGNGAGPLQECSLPTYSCIEGWTGGGEGNIALDPDFVCPQVGDFHLMALSPCIDAGDPASDFSNEPEPNGRRINMGAYGNTPEATCSSSDTDSDRLGDEWEIRWFGDLRYDGTADPDGDRILNATEFRYGWNPSVASETLDFNVATGMGYQTVQCAIWESDGGTIVVYPGIYKENVNIAGKNIILRTADPSDNPLGAQTIIDGENGGAVITLSGEEDDRCVISGFIIRGGSVGIVGGTAETHTHATIRNNVIGGNKGSGVRFCDGAIENNTIVGNGSGGAGAGLDNCKGTIVNCVIWGNGSASQLVDCSVPGYSCIEGWSGEGEGNIADDPRFVDADSADFRLSPFSPCIDAGKNLWSWGMEGTDIVGRRRLTYGGKSFNMDLGAYEYHINQLAPDAGADRATLTWSSWIECTYSIFYSDDLMTWHLAADNLPSAGVLTTSWTDDGSRTGIPPSLVRIRFYRVLENPQ
ncbi:MAG: right-handed parallel beta-helix repeat-containing protein [bacterium]|nr:right-handed parallel beta-helix repeat-containing protein [bacterium]